LLPYFYPVPRFASSSASINTDCIFASFHYTAKRLKNATPNRAGHVFAPASFVSTREKRLLYDGLEKFPAALSEKVQEFLFFSE
jgi:hypothetical protein